MSDLELIDAVKAGDYAKAETLVRNGAEINQQDEQGWAPLNFAAGKGDLSTVKLLVESGADIFHTGRDLRTPYLIALAAGRVSVVKYLMEAQAQSAEEGPARAPRKYCKAYHLGDLIRYPGWSESRINWKKQDDDGDAEEPFSNDKVVFIHQDFTVTESVWHNENVIFKNVDPDWEEFCSNSLEFKVPDDLDLIVPNEA
jgi:uncharacterized protein